MVWAKQQQDRLKAGKHYLKSDYKVAIVLITMSY